jgi:hypothetical protein
MAMTIGEQLCCVVRSLEYDFQQRRGALRMPSRNCCDMRACIDLFERVDPKVSLIETFSGGKRDTQYVRRGSHWSAATMTRTK